MPLLDELFRNVSAATDACLRVEGPFWLLGVVTNFVVRLDLLHQATTDHSVCSAVFQLTLDHWILEVPNQQT